MSLYPIGERVWACADGEWWPAKVVDGSKHNLTNEPNQSVVLYYAASGSDEPAFFDVLGAENLAFYEESSQKAVTDREDLLAAMEACKNDETALPLREAPIAPLGTKRNRTADSGAAAAASSSTKHYRKEPVAAAHAKSSSTRVVTILRVQTNLHDALERGDIIAARRCLISLSAEKMEYYILKETKIGVSVASILGMEQFKPLFPLVKAIVSDWVGKLPEQTIKAIKGEMSEEDDQGRKERK